MTTKINPTEAAQTAQKMPSATPNLTDWHTWTALVSAIGAVVTIIFHKDLNAYIPAVSIAVAGLVNVFLMITKHNYAAALATVTTTAESVSSVAPASIAGEITKAASIMQAVSNVQAAAAPVIQAASTQAQAQVQTQPVA